MKLTKMIETEIEAAAVTLSVAVRHEEEVIPDNFPGRNGDMLFMAIDIDSGVIRNWPTDFGSYDLYIEVCDQGSYFIRDHTGKIVHQVEQNYVPDFVPGEYGDYIDFKIDATGKITNWPSRSTFQECMDEDES